MDLHAPYQTYANRLGAADGRTVSFSTGSKPWDYAAAVGLGIGGDVVAEAVEISIETAVEPVYLLTLDRDYQQAGERVLVKPEPFLQRVILSIDPSVLSLVIQAGETPKSATVTLSNVSLRLVD